MDANAPQDFEQFWPYYVMEHQHPLTRAFHFLSTLTPSACLIAFFVTWQYRYLIALPIVAYGLAWFSHFAIERNKPAAWKYPLYSLMADHKMFWMTVIGQMTHEVDRIRRLTAKQR